MNAKISIFTSGIIMSVFLTLQTATAQNTSLPLFEPGKVQKLSDTEAVKFLPKLSLATQPFFGLLGTSTPALPTWSYKVVAHDGLTYSGQIIGNSPFTLPLSTTTVNLVLIPLEITINQGSASYVFNPQGTDPGCLGTGNTALNLTQQSPVFSPAPIYMGNTLIGNTSYPDALLRGSFWTAIGSSSSSAYHLGLSVTTTALQSVSYTVPATGNTTATVYGIGGTPCGSNAVNPNIKATVGVVNINSIDSQLQTIISNLGLNASQFPVFLIYYTLLSNGAANNLNNCCILGYHNALGNPGQTYALAEYDTGTLFSGTEDISVLTHELSEWIFDPYGSNPTPNWGGIGQESGCQNNLEIGDPLTGTLFPGISMSNRTYHPQELAFFSWYYTSTTYGVNKWFSSNGSFKGNAKSCPPGGTN